MASLFKRGDSYYLSFYNKNRRPQRKQVPLKTRSKRTAERLQRRFEDDFVLGKYSPWCEETVHNDNGDLRTLEGAISGFMESRANLRRASIKKYHDVLNIFVSHFSPDRPVDSITTRHIEQFLNRGNRRPITKKTYSTALRPLFGWLIEQGVIESNPVCSVRLERVPTKFPKFLSHDDVERICLLIEQEEGVKGSWLTDVIRVNVYLGLRLGEVINLKWEHIDLRDRVLTVRNSDEFSTKSGKERILPLCEAVVAILSGLDQQEEHVFLSLKNVQLSQQYTSRRFSYYARLVGLIGVNFHSTRHTCASWLAQQGCSIEAIRRYMGHSSVTVTQKYMHLSPDGFAEQIERAFGGI